MNTTSNARRQFLHASAAALAASVLPGRALAQDYPSRPVKLHVGFSAGGLTDVLARLTATYLGPKLGQTVVVENKTGAAGNIATEYISTAAPDGYNLLFSSVGQIVVSPHTVGNMRVSPQNDLSHISMVGEGDLILTVSAQVPAQDVQQFIEYVRKNPGKVFYADSGAGGNLHLYMEYFNLLAGLQMTGVHYRGTAQLMPDLVSNQVQMSLNAYPAIEAYLQKGLLRPLMIVGRQREPKLPQVPTAAEAGMPQLEVCTNWFGVHAPRNLPESIRQKVQLALSEAVKLDAMKTALAAQSIRPVGSSPAEFMARIAADSAAFEKVARTAKIQVS
ncbi:Bug family tripartite tricarboxylate transporter substrate binding protein [Azohydromonas australica]|uniref:Bug family tripartite tricarboxylate transporter substrate binding protein n=1 Tax=Azohydromonas australica TaxID=364039 RepID=UPI0003F4F0EB|nr:tripartite tricarboxylate transporter substrate binding protein [Azohydromonas australica]